MNNNGFEIDVLDGQAWIIKTINGVERDNLRAILDKVDGEEG